MYRLVLIDLHAALCLGRLMYRDKADGSACGERQGCRVSMQRGHMGAQC